MQQDVKTSMAAIDYIENNLSEKIDLEAVAFALHYSKYYLHRVFANTAGLTIYDYIHRRQLTEAAKLLVFSPAPIIDIALSAGYESLQDFSFAFKAMYKKPPGKYRKVGEFYPLQLRYRLNETPTKTHRKTDWLRQIRFAETEDISSWISLVRLLVDGFPCLQEEQYRVQLKQSILNKQSLILKDQDTAIGIMSFSPDTGAIDFLGVHPQYRRRGIAKAFLKAASILTDSPALSLTTFRQGDKADPGYRRIFKNLGFQEAELLVEFHYPTQRFVLQKAILEDIRYE